MIESILISDIATYDAAGVKIDNLKKINFIYGANGSGKTTLTKLLNDKKTPGFEKCSLTWSGAAELPTLVYNKDFRERNFGKGNINGVFTLGEATKEEKEAIEKMLVDLMEIKSKGIQKKKTLETLTEQKLQAESSFIEAAWVDVYKKHEVVFKDAFVKFMKKESFKSKLLEQVSNTEEELKTFDELKNKALTVFGKRPVELNFLSQIDGGRLLEIEADSIWSKKIIGKSDIEISKLIQHLNINDWVSEGRAYIQENNVCPFCQKETIADDFRKQIDAYFDDSFKNDTGRVKSLSSEYSLAASNLVNIVDVILTKEKEKSESKLDVEKFDAFSKTIVAYLRENEGIIKSKGKEPSRVFNLTSIKEQLAALTLLLDDANKKIKEHNKIVDNFVSEKAGLINSIWRFLFEEYKESVNQYLANDTGRQKGIGEVEKQRQELLLKYKELDAKIKEANKNLTSVQPSVDEINKTLKAYGFLNFEIVPSDNESNQYQIKREDGSIAESTLSEGEITFITFLYFLQRAKGGLTEDSVTTERVLVIDDPISSLDSNVLFIVSTLIKKILDDVKRNKGVIRQVLIFTHNVYFHKEVSYISGKAKKDNNTHFWILRKKNKVSTIQPYLMDNPIHNSYELLWRELKNKSQIDNLTIQNTMRRILENYFKILGGYHYDVLINSFDGFPEEQEICRSLVSWINDGSHSIPDDLFIQSHDDINEKYFDVFEKIFINTDHYGHFKMMLGISPDNEPVEPAT